MAYVAYQRPNQESWLPALAAAFVPVLVKFLWLWNNTQLPIADADGMLHVAYLIYERLANHEWVRFIHDLYEQRDWRPTAFYLFELPFVMISGGSIMFAARAVSLLSTLASSLYIYRLLRLELKPSLAVFATALLGITAGVQWPGTYFAFSEDAFTPAVFAAIYHLIASNSLRSHRQCLYFTVACTIAFLIRPVEAVTHLGLTFALFLVVCYRRRNVTASQLYLVIAGALVSASVLVIRGWLHNIQIHSEIFDIPEKGKVFTRIGGTVLVLTAIALLIRTGGLVQALRHHFRHLRPPYIVPSFLALYGAIIFWYFDFVPELVDWVYATSVGGLTTYVIKPSRFQILKDFVLCSGRVSFIGIVVVGIASFLTCLPADERRRLLRSPLAYLAAIMPLPLLVSLISVQYVQRKVTLVIAVLELLLLIAGLARGRWQKLRIFLLGGVFLWQLGGMLWISTGQEHNLLMEHTIGEAEHSLYGARGFPKMVTIYPHPSERLATFLENANKKQPYKTVFLPEESPDLTLIDPFTMVTVMTMRHSPFSLMLPNITEEDEHDKTRFFDKYGIDAFVLENDVDGPFVATPAEAARLRKRIVHEVEPRNRMEFDLQAMDAEGTMGSIRAHKVSCMAMVPTQHEACLFVIAPKPKAP